MRHDKSVSIPNDLVPVNLGALPAALPVNCRGLLCDIAGTVDVTMVNGQERDDVPVAAESILPGRFAALRAVGTVTAVFALV